MEKLIFVYNADSGKWNGYLDMAHKIFSPATYPCSLCDLTYGILKIRPEWDDFIKNSPIPFVFLHKDEFQRDFKKEAQTPLPVVFKQKENKQLDILIDQNELNKMTDIADLKSAILGRLAQNFE
jgi:hypothetical protein